MAIAPQRTGIGIRRRFTVAGVHPYDEVRWERRDARIVDHRDGSVAFEQLGVEVPEFWSVNATNILAQKYFRGTLGTPEREWSLKQVVDRVADTITAWGVKDGYFVDAAEAEAFRDELKYLVIHQMAAFNSPVWFNIGVAGVPQQASACQPYHSLVSTPEGMVAIGELVERAAIGEKVFDAHGITRIVAVKSNGRKPVLRVHTKAGPVLDVTADHLVWRCGSRGTGRFVLAGSLRPGDRLSWHPQESFEPRDITPVAFAEAASGQIEIEGIEELGEMDVYDIQTESGEYLSNDIRVHNCFILAVEDSMDSILNWYTEEGIIFKGGSGAGVNLSRIRSSYEHLRGGGTASGPVSFMRGADASAGTIKSGGKCFREGTLVATPDGWRPIEQLHIGDLVLTHQGPRPVADFMPNGPKLCYRVKTQEGYEVEVTEGHKFAYWNDLDEGFDVKPIEHFAPGESLYALVEPSTGGSTIALFPPGIADAASPVEIRFPSELDDRLAYVLGLWYGEGGFRPTAPNDHGLAFCKDRVASIAAERCAQYCRQLFGARPLVLGGAGGSLQIGFAHRALVDFLTHNGLAKGRADALGFPDVLFRAEVSVRAAFIAGVVDASGAYDQLQGWNFTSTDRGFLVRLQQLLLTLGIPSQLTGSRNAPTKPSTYRLSVVGATYAEHLFDSIRVYSARAQVDGTEMLQADEDWSVDEPLAPRSHQRSGGFSQRQLGATETNSGVVATLLVRRGPAAAPNEISRCVRLTLDSVTPTEVAETYDIEVEGTHLLSANGIYASNTRRAAKMVILDADHPDIEDFIWCKALEERKARVLRDAGFDMDLDGADSHSIQYQNANNSVRMTDEFMQAVIDDAEWELTARTDGSVIKRVRARDLFRQVAHAAWECADPGIQFDTTINAWHTAPRAGRITASNPCFPGSARVHTDKGLICFSELVSRVNSGESFGIYTHDATNADEAAEQVQITTPEAIMITGYNQIVRLRFDNGMELRCTPGHRIFTTNRGYVEACELKATDEVKILDLPAPAINADPALPVSTDPADYLANGEHPRVMRFPDLWTPEFAHYLGWLVGEGSISGRSVVATTYRGADARCEVLPLHKELVEWVNGDSALKVLEQEDGTAHVRLASPAFKRFLEALGVGGAEGAFPKHVPWAIEQAPQEVVAAFLRGLYDADGDAFGDEGGSSVGLLSASRELLLDVQRLLTTFGISSHLHTVESAYELRVTSESVTKFAEHIGFSLSHKVALLRAIVADVPGPSRPVCPTVRLTERSFEGIELTYNLTEPRNHSYIVDGVVVRNCSEYLHLDNSACNLASLNLLKFLDEEGNFDVEGMKHAVEVVFTAQEILVGNADYPTPKIAETSRRFRELGLGYANLGALLMAKGLPYDSDAGRAWAGAITALMCGHAYAVSARTAARMGPFAGYHDNADAMLGVLRKHQAHVAKIDEELVPPELLSAAQEAWDEAVELAQQFGVRNSQATVLAPTGTISFLLDCDTTGVEPDLGLVKMKKLVGGGSMSIVNQTVPRALRQLGYRAEQIEAIVKHIDEHKTIVGAPGLNPDHLPVFACSMGDNTIHYLGHVRMMAAIQPFISGAISKCVTGGTLIPTEDGLVRIGSLFEGEDPDTFRSEHILVASLGGSQKTDAFYYGGQRAVRRLRLRSGHHVTGTPNHRVLVVGGGGPEWKRLDEIQVGDEVATQYGANLWSQTAPRIRFRESTPSCSAERGRIPSEMNEDLAFLAGACVAQGDLGSRGSIRFTNADAAVLECIAAAARRVFGLDATVNHPDDRCSCVELRSQTAVELFEWLGCGAGTRRRIPDLVLRSPRSCVLAFLQGLFLGAGCSVLPTGRWAIRLDAPGLLDDLQAVLTNLGIVHSRISVRVGADGKPCDEVHAHGAHAQAMVRLVPFLESEKAGAAERLLAERFEEETLGLVPGISGADLYRLLPASCRSQFQFLLDPQAGRVSRRTLEQVAAVEGVVLPDWLRMILDDGLYFSSVVEVTDVGQQDVYDLSVPATHAFVGNGIVNHNTVNMPEDATVEDVENLHMEAWRLGLKAIAIYRDNCKVAQPLATTKAAGSVPPGSPAEAHDRELAARVAELERALENERRRKDEPVVVGAVRERLPRRRLSKTFAFRVADCEGYVTVGEYEDGRPGEVFIKVSKQGSTLAGIMDAFSISISLGLQHGVPLATYVRKYTNMKFEPAGLTDDPDLRLATSLVDYIFRKLALEYLPYEERLDLGVLSTAERTQPTLPGVEETTTPSAGLVDDRPIGGTWHAQQGSPVTSQVTGMSAEMRDAPYCYNCGDAMIRAGSCYVCTSCGSTSGCS